MTLQGGYNTNSVIVGAVIRGAIEARNPSCPTHLHTSGTAGPAECVFELADDGAGLPPLPDFGINLYLPRAGGTQLANELASHIRADFAAAEEISVMSGVEYLTEGPYHHGPAALLRAVFRKPETV